MKYLYLNLLLLAVLCSSLRTETMTKYRLQQIRSHLDYIHHIIFFHMPTKTNIQGEMTVWQNQGDIKFYVNDCTNNPLPQCESPERAPVIILFNRVLIRYNGDPQNLEEIVTWIESRIMKHPKNIQQLQELQKMLKQTPNVFCFVPDNKKEDESGLFLSLAKSLPFLNYCTLNNAVLAGELGLKVGNLTYFLDNSTNRRQFEHPNRYDAWEWFIKANLIPSIGRAQNLVEHRFSNAQKNISVIAVVCDFSFNCQKIWQKIKLNENMLRKDTIGHDFVLAIQDQKQSFTFNLYFHLTFDMTKLPAFVHIDLKSNGQDTGTLIRHIEYIDQKFQVQTVLSFARKIERGQVNSFNFSAQVPKKNGFTGKGGQKFIQKVVGTNVEQIIADSKNHYVLLLTALNIGCDSCETFYKQYKQIAALFKDKDVTFGLLNVNENEIPLRHVTQLPDLFLYPKEDKSHPIRMNVHHSFDHLMLFFKNNLGDAYSNPDEL